ncbi:MAG: nitronate monooxygenase [Gammaproteobacteria bacterium]|nr:nitronate monooxygenase [Gammaproteobacteria bacterium]
MLKTALCRSLGIEYPIFSAGMGGNMSGPELAAAVSNAGGLGVLGFGGLPTEFMRAEIARLRSQTDRPFGANIILPMLGEGQIEVCMDARVPVLVLFWGDPKPYVADAHRRGMKVFLQVGSAEEASAAVAAGVDGIIAQGMEAGGHVKSTVALTAIVPETVQAVTPVPVVAAGGVADGRGLVAALGLGAQAVSMGTRFLASEECAVAYAYKERIVASQSHETVYTTLFDIGWPDAAHRVLRNRAVAVWEAAGSPPPGQRPGEGEVNGRMRVAGDTIDAVRYSVFPPMPEFTGDVDDMALYAGESCGLVHDIRPAAQIVNDIMAEARAVVAELSGG